MTFIFVAMESRIVWIQFMIWVAYLLVENLVVGMENYLSYIQKRQNCQKNKSKKGPFNLLYIFLQVYVCCNFPFAYQKLSN